MRVCSEMREVLSSSCVERKSFFQIALPSLHAVCAWIKNGTRKGIVIEWRKSHTWGMNPHISLGDEREAVRVSGCGYCKESTAIAHTLCYLFEPDTEAFKDVSHMAGAGVPSVAEALKKYGWKLEAVAEGKNIRAYSVTKI